MRAKQDCRSGAVEGVKVAHLSIVPKRGPQPIRPHGTRGKRSRRANLNVIQRWVQEVITHPNGVECGIEAPAAQKLIPIESEQLDEVILPGMYLSSHERIGIYASMYYLRLVECLGKDFAAVHYALGEERFDELARLFIPAHPSRHYSLNYFGAHFPKFLATEVEDLPNREFLSELAQLEWAVQEVFDDVMKAPLKVEDLVRIKTADAADVRARLIPALRLLEFHHQVHRFLQAFYNEKEPGLPNPKQNWALVFRKGYRVWRAALCREQFMILSAIKDGATLAMALDQCAAAPECDAALVEKKAGKWFEEWARDGLFYAINAV